MNFLLSASYTPSIMKAFSSRYPVVFLYHGIPDKGDTTFIDGEIFEQQITFLKNYCDFVTPDDLGKRRKAFDRIQVLLTFDDGFRNNAEIVAPILRRHHVPAVFFVCSRHATPGKYLWFVYFRALEKYFKGNGFSFGGEFFSMSNEKRRTNIKILSDYILNLTPHPSEMYKVIDEEFPCLEDFISNEDLINHYAGMTDEQIAELASDPLFSIGAHTADHPLLTHCDPKEVSQQIESNKDWIEQVCNTSCTSLAYPSGDYNAEVLQIVRNCGFTHSYAVEPKLRIDFYNEIPRIGIYSTSLDILGFKAYWGNSLRALRIKIG